MKDKKVGNVLKTETKVIAYVVICLVIIVLGISYALFFEVKGNEKNQIVKAGTLEFTYANGSQITNATNSDCFIPMNNEEALRHSECEYKISIRNAGTLPGNYSINLSNVSVENPIALNKLKVILKKEGQVVAGYPKEGTTTSLVLNEKIEAGSVINYSVQVYVDVDNELLNAEDDEKNISLKINGEAVVNSEEINPTDKTIATNFITELAKSDTTNLMKDGTKDNNIRYVGGSPNNYIDIGDRTKSGEKILWRVIGVMNNINSIEPLEENSTLLKIIRADSIGEYSWDVTDKNINSGNGVNEWSQADLMKLLNPGYDDNQDINSEGGLITVNNSLYWNNSSGNCYNNDGNVYEECDFSDKGISDEAKNKIAKVTWYTGTFESRTNTEWMAINAYEAERSKHHGKQLCMGLNSDLCTDNVPRTTTWDGYIGLMYPSDYGFAVGGSVRSSCLEKSMNVFFENDCFGNSWIFNKSDIWTISPIIGPTQADGGFMIRYSGSLVPSRLSLKFTVTPTAYLKSSTRILPNPNLNLEYGSKENPFVIQ